VATGDTVYAHHALMVERQAVVRQLSAVHVRDGRIYAVDDHFLYASSDTGRTFHLLGRLPKVRPTLVGKGKDLVARTRLIRRIRQNPGPGALVVLRSGTILVFYDFLYRSADGGRTFAPVLSFQDSIPGPLGPNVTVDAEDRVYFGEYDTSPRPRRVRVWRGTDDGRCWNVALEFPRGAVFHVHGVQYDPYRRGLWILTGDRDVESAVLFTADDFRTVDTLGHGSQDWRVVRLIATPDALYWGTDNDRTGADIVRWSFATQRLERVRHIGKVSYFSTRLSDGSLAITTTHEPDSPFTLDKNPPPTTELWVSRNGEDWHVAWALPAAVPRGPSRAQLVIPSGDYSMDRLIVSPRHVREGGHTVQVFRLWGP
jgi:hypothetical protein